MSSPLAICNRYARCYGGPRACAGNKVHNRHTRCLFPSRSAIGMHDVMDLIGRVASDGGWAGSDGDCAESDGGCVGSDGGCVRSDGVCAGSDGGCVGLNEAV